MSRRLRLLWLNVLAACGEGGAGDESAQLSIEISSYEPRVLVVADDARDDLALELEYHDPHGALGEGVAEIFDCRGGSLITRLALPPIASDAAVAEQVAIHGQLTLHVADVSDAQVGALPAACQGQPQPSTKRTTFCVRLTDAKGRESNVACSGAVTIEP